MVFWWCENFVTCQSVFYLSLHHISWSPASFPLFPQSHGRRDILSETIPHQLTPCFQEEAQAGKVHPNSVAPCSHMWLQVCSPLYKHPTCPHLRIFWYLIMLNLNVGFKGLCWFAWCVWVKNWIVCSCRPDAAATPVNVGRVPSQKVKAWRGGLGAASSALDNRGFEYLLLMEFLFRHFSSG